MDLGLAHKAALVVGGSSGPGLAIALELAAEGADVAIGARDRDRLAAAERSLKEVARGRILAASVDATDPAAARDFVELVAGELGALHIVVISGGSPPIGTAARVEHADFQAAVDGVLMPAVVVARAALPHLRTAGWGRLLFVASETASVPVAELALSGITRSGIVRLAQSLAAESGRDGITVNVLAPAVTRTPMVERAAARLAEDGDVETQLRAMGRYNALRRIARPDEIAAVAAFLASERASYVTGQVYLIDGGASVTGPEQEHLLGAQRDTYT